MDFGFLDKIGFDLEVALANLVNFLLIFIVFKLFFYKPIAEVLAERKQKIHKGLDDAERAARQLEEAAAAKSAMLIDAKKEAAELLDDARTHAQSVQEKTLATAEARAAEIEKEAVRDIEAARTRMEEEVEAKMTDMVAELTKKSLVNK